MTCAVSSCGTLSHGMKHATNDMVFKSWHKIGMDICKLTTSYLQAVVDM
jgi:hypothetical protein